jgi:hypothetical protein
MPDDRKELATKYQLAHRYANFGPSLKSIHIQGFRGIADMKVDFQYPITAISGLNGGGKSTVGQLCLGGYRKPSTVTDQKRFYVRDFFPASPADPVPFSAESAVVFEYNTSDPDTPQKLTVARANTEWSGYKRQPERSCFYIGFTLYIPKVEQRDLSITYGRMIELSARRPIADDVRDRVGRILGQQYDGMHFQGVSHRERHAELGIAVRFGAQYSENNMGFGEGRTLYMVDLMEKSPEQSLFVIEEPETSLHGNAQYELAKYLLDVCNRRHHQIVLTTHSSTVLDALPTDARVMLVRDSAGVAAFPGMSAARGRSILSGGRQRDLCVFVEDGFAKLLLTEMIRRIDVGMLRCLEIHDIGDKKAVRSGALLMQRLQRPYAAVRDADVGPAPAEGLYSFPGTRPPEREVFTNADVLAYLQRTFQINADHVFVQRQITNHHDFNKVLAKEADLLPDYLATSVINVYLDSIGNAAFAPVVSALLARLP